MLMVHGSACGLVAILAARAILAVRALRGPASCDSGPTYHLAGPPGNTQRVIHVFVLVFLANKKALLHQGSTKHPNKSCHNSCCVCCSMYRACCS